MSDNNAYIDGLLRERKGYERRGLDDMVAGVDEELERVGYSPPAQPARPAQPETASLEATETATVPKGRPRRSVPNG